jgi:hypothetical protein
LSKPLDERSNFLDRTACLAHQSLGIAIGLSPPSLSDPSGDGSGVIPERSRTA